MSPFVRYAALAGAALLFPVCLPAVETPVRLFEIPVNRFIVDEDDGERRTERGLVDPLGRFRITSVSPTPSTVTVPPEALNRWTITYDAWLAYGNLGPDAVANFQIVESTPYTIGQRVHYPILPRMDAKFDVGHLVNISTRAKLTPGDEPIIGGFVVEGQHRTVLIRGVGPALASMGVTDALEDPYIVIHKAGSNQFQLFNDNWGQRYDADIIEEMAEQIGAFPLPRGSKDAAILYELEPGAYTVHLGADTGTAGTALIEVYILP